MAGEVEPEVPRPTQFNLDINDSVSSDSPDAEGSVTNSPSVETAALADQVIHTSSDSPPDYALVIASSMNHKQVVGHRA